MTNKKEGKKSLNVPNLRFPEFEGEWEEYKISDFLEFFSTNSLSWEQLEYNTENLYNLHYGLIHKGLPTQIELDKCILPNINDEFIPNKYTVCREGDIAFADASEDTNDAAKAVEFLNCDNKNIVCGLHTIHGRDKKHLTIKGFKGYAFSSTPFRNQVRRLAQGTKIYSINSKNFDELYISIPPKEEQTKIAHLLLLIDDRISTQSKIIEKYESLIKGLNKKLFSQKLKFKDDNRNNYPDWEIKKLEEVMSIPEKIKPTHIDKNKLLTVKLHLKGISKNENTETLSFGATNYFIRKKGQFIYGKQNLFNGAFGLVPDEFDGFLSSGDVPALDVNNENLNSNFLVYYFSRESFYKKLEDISSGSGSKRIHETTLLNVEIPIPTLEEQKKIVDFISVINKQLKIEKQILKKYTEQKKYLLASLFI